MSFLVIVNKHLILIFVHIHVNILSSSCYDNDMFVLSSGIVTWCVPNGLTVWQCLTLKICQTTALYLSLISKITERVVKSRLTTHLSSNNLLNPHQSAYSKHHSTETALLYIHDHLVNATGSQQVSCLCLLDLSAAFDTIDHNILLSRLSSWFGIHGTVLNWFKSYLSSCSFRVHCSGSLSSPHTIQYNTIQWKICTQKLTNTLSV